jgi:hypothetical protein
MSIMSISILLLFVLVAYKQIKIILLMYAMKPPLHYLLVLFALLLCVVVTVNGQISLTACQHSSSGYIDDSVAIWNKNPSNAMSSSLEYHVCGKTFTSYSFVTHAKLYVKIQGAILYTYSAKIREPSNQDIDPNNFCFHGTVTVNLPFISVPPGASVHVDFYEADKEPLLNLCYN